MSERKDPVPAWTVVRRRQPLRLAGEIAVWAGAAALAWTLAWNKALNWSLVGVYLLDGTVLRGLALTIELTAIAMLVALIVGLALAIFRMSQSATFSGAARLYIWIFRGTPALVQLVFWYNLSTIFPRLWLCLPGLGACRSIPTNDVMSSLAAAILGLGLNEAAYMAEIIRSGIESVEIGHVEAAAALGMTPWRSFRRIVLPQAMRVILPPTGNETIGMLKYTSLASVVALKELLESVTVIYATNFEVIPLLLVASIWYLILTSILSFGQSLLERRFRRGTAAPRKGNR